MILLHIETSTNICSIALSENQTCIFSKSNADGMNHAALLSSFIKEGLDFLKTENKKLDGVAVSSGPGSYTGLRIGVSTAKGLCYGMDIPLIGVSTLEVLTTEALKRVTETENALFCPMIDARRMEVYAAFYNNDLALQREIAPDIIDENSYAEILDNNLVYFFGNGADKCKSSLTHTNTRFLNDIVPLAENMIPLAVKAFNESRFENIAYFEPFYLKEFHTTAPKQTESK